ncbi:MAG TPA: hypothetical protein VJL83_01385 [Patescibacteria group bacterium]|nr:hypothetical protein [Patescibacteria group bacterium]
MDTARLYFSQGFSPLTIRFKEQLFFYMNSTDKVKDRSLPKKQIISYVKKSIWEKR